MFRLVLVTMLLVGAAMAACGPGLGGDYAADCRLSLRRELPGQAIDALGEPGPATVVSEAVSLFWYATSMSPWMPRVLLPALPRRVAALR